MKILFTGGTGFIGRNILPILKEKYTICAPTRSELNVLNSDEVERYIKNENFDIVIHSANTNPVKNAAADGNIDLFEGSLRCFMNFYRLSKYYGKMYYFGSGAEFDKSRDIQVISEAQFDRSVPSDGYGFAKYIMNELAVQSTNIYNLRIFAIYGPTDHYSKFITHCIHCILNNENITIRQDCLFDYMHISDLAYIMEWFIEHTPSYHSYNICSGERHSLSEIANLVKEEMGSDALISILKKGRNNEYSADNSRLLRELGGYQFKSLQEGIRIQIESQKGELR